MKRYLDIWTAEKIMPFLIKSDEENPSLKNAETRDVVFGMSESKMKTQEGILRRKDLEIYTEKRLAETVNYVFCRSSFYQSLIGDEMAKAMSMVNGSEFMKLFHSLPFTDHDNLRKHGQEMLCVGAGDISRIVTLDTGGSTGEPKRIYFTEEDQQLTVDFFRSGMKLIVDNTDKVLILMPAKTPGSIGRLLGKSLADLGAYVIEYGLPSQYESEAERLLNLMADERVTSVVALPTHMKMLAESLISDPRFEFDEFGKAGGIKLKTVLLSAEYVPSHVVDLLEKVFGCKVYEHYGMTEMGLGCAVSCGYGEGYHIRESDLYIEIIDPKTGRNVGDGEMGEVVFTTLTRKGMPLIRYRTGDYSRIIKEPCSCGSVLRRLAKVGDREATKGYLL